MSEPNNSVLLQLATPAGSAFSEAMNPTPAAPLDTAGPAPQLLSPERLAEIEKHVDDWANSWVLANSVQRSVAVDLLAHAAALSTQLAAAQTIHTAAGPWTEGLERNRQQFQQDYFAMKQRAEAAENKAAALSARLKEEQDGAAAEKLDLLAEFYAGNEPVQYDVNDSRRRTHEKNGENRERGRLRSWVIIRAHQMGIDPNLLRQRPAKGFDAPAAPLPPQGGPAAGPGETEDEDSIPALMALAARFHERGNTAAWSNIRAAAHNIGFCIDSAGVDKIEPTEDECPLCRYDSAAHPEPMTEEEMRRGRIGKYLWNQPEDAPPAPAVAPEPQPWCVRCPATEADVNTPGFRCQQCADEGIFSPEELAEQEENNCSACPRVGTGCAGKEVTNG